MAEHARTIRVTTFTVADGQLDQLVEAASSNADDAAAAEGCFGAQVLRPEGRDDVVAVISRWRDREPWDLRSLREPQAPSIAGANFRCECAAA